MNAVCEDEAREQFIAQREKNRELSSLLDSAAKIAARRELSVSRDNNGYMLPVYRPAPTPSDVKRKRRERIDALNMLPDPPMPIDQREVALHDLACKGEPLDNDKLTCQLIAFYDQQWQEYSQIAKKQRQLYSRYALDAEYQERIGAVFTQWQGMASAASANALERRNRIRDARMEMNAATAPMSTCTVGQPHRPLLQSDDLETYARSLIHRANTTHRARRFFQRLRWLPNTRRHEVVRRARAIASTDVISGDNAVNFCHGLRGFGFEHFVDAELAGKQPPVMPVLAQHLSARTALVAQYFGLKPGDEDNGLALDFTVSQSFTTCFIEDDAKLKSYAEASTPSLGKKSTTFTKPSRWVSFVPPHLQADLSEEAVRSEQAFVAAVRRVDVILKTELEFLNCPDVEHVIARLNALAASHSIRASVRSHLLMTATSGGEECDRSDAERRVLSGRKTVYKEGGLNIGSEAFGKSDQDHEQFVSEQLAAVKRAQEVEEMEAKAKQAKEDNGKSTLGGAGTALSRLSGINNASSSAPLGKRGFLHGDLERASLHETQLRPYYSLRFLRTRAARKRLRSVLNALRSVQRRLTIDAHGFSNEDVDPSVGPQDISKAEAAADAREKKRRRARAEHAAAASNAATTVAEENAGLGTEPLFSADELEAELKTQAMADERELSRATCPVLPMLHSIHSVPSDYKVPIERLLAFKGTHRREDRIKEFRHASWPLPEDPSSRIFAENRDYADLAAHSAIAATTSNDTEASGEKGGELVVEDSQGVRIMYSAALDDLDALDERLLLVGSHYIQMFESRHSPTLAPKASTMRAKQRYNKDNGANHRPGDGVFLCPTVDRSALLCDLYEAEALFQYSKWRVIDVYLEAYEHCSDSVDASRIARKIVLLCALRPRLDASAPYFASSYASEISAMNLERVVASKLLSYQLSHEMDLTMRASRAYGNFEDSLPPTQQINGNAGVTATYGAQNAVGELTEILNMVPRAIPGLPLPSFETTTILAGQGDSLSFVLPTEAKFGCNVEQAKMSRMLGSDGAQIGMLDVFASAGILGRLSSMLDYLFARFLELEHRDGDVDDETDIDGSGSARLTPFARSLLQRAVLEAVISEWKLSAADVETSEEASIHELPKGLFGVDNVASWRKKECVEDNKEPQLPPPELCDFDRDGTQSLMQTALGLRVVVDTFTRRKCEAEENIRRPFAARMSGSGGGSTRHSSSAIMSRNGPPAENRHAQKSTVKKRIDPQYERVLLWSRAVEVLQLQRMLCDDMAETRLLAALYREQTLAYGAIGDVDGGSLEGGEPVGSLEAATGRRAAVEELDLLMGDFDFSKLGIESAGSDDADTGLARLLRRQGLQELQLAVKVQGLQVLSLSTVLEHNQLALDPIQRLQLASGIRAPGLAPLLYDHQRGKGVAAFGASKTSTFMTEGTDFLSGESALVGTSEERLHKRRQQLKRLVSNELNAAAVFRVSLTARKTFCRNACLKRYRQKSEELYGDAAKATAQADASEASKIRAALGVSLWKERRAEIVRYITALLSSLSPEALRVQCASTASLLRRQVKAIHRRAARAGDGKGQLLESPFTVGVSPDGPWMDAAISVARSGDTDHIEALVAATAGRNHNHGALGKSVMQNDGRIRNPWHIPHQREVLLLGTGIDGLAASMVTVDSAEQGGDGCEPTSSLSSGASKQSRRIHRRRSSTTLRTRAEPSESQNEQSKVLLSYLLAHLTALLDIVRVSQIICALALPAADSDAASRKEARQHASVRELLHYLRTVAQEFRSSPALIKRDITNFVNNKACEEVMNNRDNTNDHREGHPIEALAQHSFDTEKLLEFEWRKRSLLFRKLVLGLYSIADDAIYNNDFAQVRAARRAVQVLTRPYLLPIYRDALALEQGFDAFGHAALREFRRGSNRSTSAVSCSVDEEFGANAIVSNIPPAWPSYWWCSKQRRVEASVMNRVAHESLSKGNAPSNNGGETFVKRNMPCCVGPIVGAHPLLDGGMAGALDVLQAVQTCWASMEGSTRMRASVVFERMKLQVDETFARTPGYGAGGVAGAIRCANPVRALELEECVVYDALRRRKLRFGLVAALTALRHAGAPEKRHKAVAFSRSTHLRSFRPSTLGELEWEPSDCAAMQAAERVISSAVDSKLDRNLRQLYQKELLKDSKARRRARREQRIRAGFDSDDSDFDPAMDDSDDEGESDVSQVDGKERVDLVEVQGRQNRAVGLNPSAERAEELNVLQRELESTLLQLDICAARDAHADIVASSAAAEAIRQNGSGTIFQDGPPALVATSGANSAAAGDIDAAYVYKASIASLLLASLRDRAERSLTMNGKDAFTIATVDLERCIATFARRLITWSDRIFYAKLLSSNTLLAQSNERLYQAEQRCAVQIYEAGERAKNAAHHVKRAVVDGNYKFMFEVERLQLEIEKGRTRLRAQEARIREKVKAEFEQKINLLSLQLKCSQGRFAEYETQMQHEMLKRLNEVKRDAMVQMVSSGSVPMQLRRRTLKAVRADDELQEAKVESMELKRTVLKLKTMYEMKAMQSKHRHLAEKRQLQEKINDGSELWARVAAMERRETQLKAEVLELQTAVQEEREKNAAMKSELATASSARSALVSYKVSAAKKIEALTKNVARFESWKTLDVDKLASELEKKSKELADLRGRREVSNTRQRQSEDRGSKEVERLRGLLLEERKLKQDAFSKIRLLRAKVAENSGDGANANADGEYTSSAAWIERYNQVFTAYQHVLSQNEAMRARFHAIGMDSDMPPAGVPHCTSTKTSAISSLYSGISVPRTHSKNSRQFRSSSVGQRLPASPIARMKRPSSAHPRSKGNSSITYPVRPSTASHMRKNQRGQGGAPQKRRRPKSGYISAKRGVDPGLSITPDPAITGTMRFNL